MGFAGIAAERRENCQRVLNAAQIRRRECVLMQMAQHPAIVLLPLAGIPATRMQYMAFPPKNEMKDCPDTPRVFSR